MKFAIWSGLWKLLDNPFFGIPVALLSVFAAFYLGATVWLGSVLRLLLDLGVADDLKNELFFGLAMGIIFSKLLINFFTFILASLRFILRRDTRIIQTHVRVYVRKKIHVAAKSLKRRNLEISIILSFCFSSLIILGLTYSFILIITANLSFLLFWFAIYLFEFRIASNLESPHLLLRKPFGVDQMRWNSAIKTLMILWIPFIAFVAGSLETCDRMGKISTIIVGGDVISGAILFVGSRGLFLTESENDTCGFLHSDFSTGSLVFLNFSAVTTVREEGS